MGDIFISAATPAATCNANGKVAGDVWQTIFMPAGLPGNKSSDRLMGFAVRQLSALRWQPASGAHLDGATSILGVGIDSGDFYQAKGGSPIPVKSFSVKPAAPTAQTQSVTISFSITDSNGCTTTASGVLARWPFN